MIMEKLLVKNCFGSAIIDDEIAKFSQYCQTLQTLWIRTISYIYQIPTRLETRVRVRDRRKARDMPTLYTLTNINGHTWLNGWWWWMSNRIINTQLIDDVGPVGHWHTGTVDIIGIVSSRAKCVVCKEIASSIVAYCGSS